MSALIHWSVIPYWGVIHSLSSQRELSFFTQPSLTEVAEGILQHSLFCLKGQWEVKIDWSVPEVNKVVKIHIRVKHNARFQEQTWRLQQDVVGILIVWQLLCVQQKTQRAHQAHVCVMHANARILISRDMVTWLTCSACIIHNSNCLQKIHILWGKFSTSALWCNFQQRMGHATDEQQPKLLQEALLPKGGLLALRQGY